VTAIRGDLSLVLLPGMDGTGRLFDPFLDELPAALSATVVRYPVDRPLGYADLEPLVESALPTAGPFVLLAESFSGPLALRVAARGHPRLVAVVVVGSFARSPVGRCLSSLRHVIGSWCFRFAPPSWLIRRFLAGADAPAELVAAARTAAAAVAPAAMAKRIREVLAVDVRSLLPETHVPVLYIAGSRDRLIAPRSVEDFQTLGGPFQSATLDAPHLILQTQPAAAAQLIEQFLKTRCRPAGEPENQKKSE
jgi:pimeloyl-[acyl-carrier protein] methyl ester esterase